MIWKAEILAILSRHGGNIREHFEMWTRCSHQSELLSSTYLVLFMLLLLFCLKNISIPCVAGFSSLKQKLLHRDFLGE